MAFAYEVTDSTVFGNKRVKWGTFTNGGSDTGGDVVTGLTRVDGFIAYHSGAAVVASAPAVNETFPLASGDVTIVTTAGADGYWLAWGVD